MRSSAVRASAIRRWRSASAERGARSIGVDLSPQMIAAARQRRPEGDLRVADASQLPFADGELSGYRAEKLFHALDEPTAALAEAYRVLTPGGRIVLIGQDWDTLVIDSDDPQLTRTIVHARADTFPSPRAARQYRSLLLDAGFADITVEARTGVLTDATMLPMLTDFANTAHTLEAITADQAREWSTEQARRATTGRLFFAVPVFLASARRPEPATS
ncbi:methyltransferase domain-containing protein (plasmid) [Streptomyces sp. NBC_01321]|uniref:methyltransferase domain-containing protein n=3 Tax=unclassified Streptomyces TaxID=2593676 RepID=UPI002E11634A|nr:methyltransferase domain-containing protein [Streptomyces sp. NBC_01321]